MGEGPEKHYFTLKRRYLTLLLHTKNLHDNQLNSQGLTWTYEEVTSSPEGDCMGLHVAYKCFKGLEEPYKALRGPIIPLVALYGS